MAGHGRRRSSRSGRDVLDAGFRTGTEAAGHQVAGRDPHRDLRPRGEGKPLRLRLRPIGEHGGAGWSAAGRGEAGVDPEHFYVIFYNDRLHVFSPAGSRGRLVFATEENRRAARRFVEGVRADGGTRHAEALAAAFRLAPDVVFLLTDADAKDDLTDAELERLSRLGSGSRCMVVQFGDESRRSPRLADLAARCGGAYRILNLEGEPVASEPVARETGEAADEADTEDQLGR